MPKISVVIPAYNAELYIEETIKSILCQTFNDLEIIIIDHASTDRTRDIINKFAEKDNRIVFKSLTVNMGGGKHAADIAYSIARGEWVIRVDSDDYLVENSLETLYKRAIETQTDIVLQKMFCFKDGSNDVLKIYSAPDSNVGQILEGREAVRLTVGRWEIGCNGMLIKKTLIPEYNESKTPTYINSDEIDSRIFLLNAKYISFCQSSYMYRVHKENTGKKPSIRRVEILLVDELLESFLRENYDSTDIIFEDLTSQKCRHLLGFYLFYFKNLKLFKLEDNKRTLEIMHKFYKGINFKLLKGKYSILMRLSLMSGHFLFNISTNLYSRIR
jgi:glycosyltransferase involved in cell wall biosynthesis